MRAGRLLTILLTLADEGRTTTSALASRLEVSRRTVLRDLQELGGSGVPIVTYAGPGGGVELLDGWRSSMRGLPGSPGGLGLTVGPDSLLAHALGVEEGPAPDGWLVIDPETAPQYAVAPELLRDAARACRDGTELVVTADGVRRVLRPVRLVLRAGRWWLVAAGGGTGPSEIPLDTLIY